MNRGVDFTEPRLYVLDGGKALHAAVKRHAGDAAPIQRERQVGSGPIVAEKQFRRIRGFSRYPRSAAFFLMAGYTKLRNAVSSSSNTSKTV
jgi:hypothetical protein